MLVTVARKKFWILICRSNKVEVPCVRLVRLTTCNICLGRVGEFFMPRIGLVVVEAAGLSRRVSRREVHKENILTRDECLLTAGVCNVIIMTEALRSYQYVPFGFNSMLLYPPVVNVFIAVVIEELRERVVLTETGVHNGCFSKRKFYSAHCYFGRMCSVKTPVMFFKKPHMT